MLGAFLLQRQRLAVTKHLLPTLMTGLVELGQATVQEGPIQVSISEYGLLGCYVYITAPLMQ